MPTFLVARRHVHEAFRFFQYRRSLDARQLARHAERSGACCARLWNTLPIGLGSGVVGILFYALIAYMVVKTRHRGRWLLDFFLGCLGRFRAFSAAWRCCGPFSQTKIFLPIYGTDLSSDDRHGDQEHALRHADDQKRADSTRQRSRGSFESLRRARGCIPFRRVILPLTMPALITVGLVGFISAARDISTVVLLGSGKSRTLSLLMLDFAAGADSKRPRWWLSSSSA